MKCSKDLGHSYVIAKKWYHGDMYARWYASRFRQALARPYVNLVFGARQSGKTTLIRALLPNDALRVDLADPGTRSTYERNPAAFSGEIRALPC